MKSIISIREARKLLGKKYAKLTDEEVAELIGQTHEFAKLALEVAKGKIAREERSDEKDSELPVAKEL